MTMVMFGDSHDAKGFMYIWQDADAKKKKGGTPASHVSQMREPRNAPSTDSYTIVSEPAICGSFKLILVREHISSESVASSMLFYCASILLAGSMILMYMLGCGRLLNAP